MSMPGESSRGHDRPRPVRRPPFLFFVLGVIAVLGACSTASDGDDVALAIDRARPNEGRAFAMVADALDQGAIEPLQSGDLLVVIAPTDDAVLGLDADALAELVGGDGIAGLLRRSVVRAGYEEPLREGLSLLLGDGTTVSVEEVDGALLLGDLPLVETVGYGLFQLLVVDGLVIEP